MGDKFITAIKVDEFGRIALPQEAQAILGVDTGETLSVTVSKNRIILEKQNPSCAICDTFDGEFKQCNEKSICMVCVKQLSK